MPPSSSAATEPPAGRPQPTVTAEDYLEAVLDLVEQVPPGRATTYGTIAEVLRERYLSFHLDLPLEAFDILFAAKAEWDDGLDGISASTRAKLRQVLFRIMREAHVVSDDNRIQSAIISSQLKRMLEADCPADIILLPGLSRDGAP